MSVIKYVAMIMPVTKYAGTVILEDEKMNNGNYTMTEWLLTSRPGHFGLVPGSAYPTGVILLIILVIMTLCSMSFVRRGGCFEVPRLLLYTYADKKSNFMSQPR